MTASATQNAFHTPTGPNSRLSKNAAGRMTTMYRHREITSEGVPLPSPSSAPEAVTETAETKKPALMMRSAVSPARMVSGVCVNRPISCPGITRQTTVPSSMIAPLMHSTTRKICRTRPCSPAP